MGQKPCPLSLNRREASNQGEEGAFLKVCMFYLVPITSEILQGLCLGCLYCFIPFINGISENILFSKPLSSPLDSSRYPLLKSKLTQTPTICSYLLNIDFVIFYWTCAFLNLSQTIFLWILYSSKRMRFVILVFATQVLISSQFFS